MKRHDIILPNVRFRLWVSRVGASGSWVKVTLRPGQVIACGYTTPTTEGWDSCYTQVTYDACGPYLTAKVGSEGRTSWRDEAEADIITCSDDGQPIWCSPSYALRDASAETMGDGVGKGLRRMGDGSIRVSDAECVRWALGPSIEDIFAQLVDGMARPKMEALEAEGMPPSDRSATAYASLKDIEKRLGPVDAPAPATGRRHG